MKTIKNYKNRLMRVRNCLLIILFFLSAVVLHAQTIIYNSSSADNKIRLDYRALYTLHADLEQGILGEAHDVSGNWGKITVKVYDYDENSADNKGILIYYVYLSPSSKIFGEPSPNGYWEEHLPTTLPLNYSGGRLQAASNDIKKNAQNAKVYGPTQCTYTTWSSGFAHLVYPRSGCLGESPEFIQPVVVEITLRGVVTFSSAKIPGIGVVTIENGEVVRSPPGKLYSYCHSNSSSALCQLYNTIRQPNMSSGEDFLIAAHRGWWGYDMGASTPENTVESIGNAYKKGVKLVEMDVTISADNELILMHDYVMKRLTNYSGTEFSFELPWSTIGNYKVRRRNGDVASLPISRFRETFSTLENKGMIMMMDIKELQSDGIGGKCKSNCDYQSDEIRKKSWADIATRALREAQSGNVVKNLIFKAPYTPDELYGLLGGKMNSVLWTPVILPKNFKNAEGVPDIQLMADFVDLWNTDLTKHLIACFETNFFRPDDEMLQSFTRNGTTYQNLLHYVYATTGRRPGAFSEDPVNPKGTTTRWGTFRIKNCDIDFRGDAFRLKDIPYGKIMLITSDRLDVWQQMKDKF